MKLLRQWIFIGAGFVLSWVPGAQAQTQAREFFDDRIVHDIKLEVDVADWALLQQHYLENTYFRATFSWNGITQSIGIRSRGTGSRSPIKPNLTFNFSKYVKKQNFLGLDKVSLKANNQDASNLREWLVMKLFRRMGLPAPREAPARLYVNNTYLGFYTIVELLDETFLQRNFGENGGYLYSWNAIDTYNFNDLGPDPAAYAPFLELETSQDSPDLQNFANLVAIVNRPLTANYTEADFLRDLSKYINPKLYLTYAAIETLVDDKDGILNGVFGMNNFDLYQFKGQTLYQMIVWDKDMTFEYSGRDIVDGITQAQNINVLAQRLFAIPEYKTAYLAALKKASTILGDTNGWANEEIARQYALIREHAIDDPNKQCSRAGVLFSCDSREFEDNVQALRTFLNERAAIVNAQISGAGYIPSENVPQIATATISGGGDQGISSGALVTISGFRMGQSAESPGIPLKCLLANTFVAVDGIRAPILTTSAEKIGIQVPWDVSMGQASIAVSVNGAFSNTLELEARLATPAIFGVLHANGMPVTPQYPLSPGETVEIFATGLGAVDINLNSGAAGPAQPLACTKLKPKVSLQGLTMEVTFSGLAPGFAGLYQVNATAPESLPANKEGSLNLTAGEASASMQIALP